MTSLKKSSQVVYFLFFGGSGEMMKHYVQWRSTGAQLTNFCLRSSEEVNEATFVTTVARVRLDEMLLFCAHIARTVTRQVHVGLIPKSVMDKKICRATVITNSNREFASLSSAHSHLSCCQIISYNSLLCLFEESSITILGSVFHK